MEEKKLKVAAPKQEVQAQMDPKSITGYYVPAAIMDQIIGYIGQGSWLEVNDFMNQVRSSVQPVFAKSPVTETEKPNN